MQDPIRLTARARLGKVVVTLNYYRGDDPSQYYEHCLEPDAARWSALQLRRAAEGQDQPARGQRWDVFLTATRMNEQDCPDWVRVDLVDRNFTRVGPAERGGIERNGARNAADSLEAAADAAEGQAERDADGWTKSRPG